MRMRHKETTSLSWVLPPYLINRVSWKCSDTSRSFFLCHTSPKKCAQLTTSQDINCWQIVFDVTQFKTTYFSFSLFSLLSWHHPSKTPIPSYNLCVCRSVGQWQQKKFEIRESWSVSHGRDGARKRRRERNWKEITNSNLSSSFWVGVMYDLSLF